ncbi:chloride channel protein 2-like [Halichondria panicea]|uniref:chloride channel protein 2-like n=1 Tax=Halichondria panicea TaxID=6063 RepID=UPI00312B6697
MESQSTTQLEYEKTLMYGQYSQLQEFAKDYASRTKIPKPLGIEETRRRKSRKWRAWKYLEANILPYIIDWVFIFVLGILMAGLSFGLDYIISKILTAQHILSLQLVESPFVQYLFWVSFSLVFILFSVSVVQAISTHAIGSGIPEMKTILRGIRIPGYLNIKTFISKSIGLTAAVGAGLPIGKEGPFVHLACIIANLMNKIITTVNTVFSNEAHNNELLAAACAVGVSCNFAAPIGGVLFSIEVTSTYFAVRNYWRGFFGAVCGAFLFRLAGVVFGDEVTITALFKTSFQPDFPFDLLELVSFAGIGIVSGLIGALFVWYHRNYVLLRRKLRKYTTLLDKHVFIAPIIVTFLFASLTFRPGLGQFMAGELTQQESIGQLFSNKTWILLPFTEANELPLDSEDYQIVKQWGSPSIWVSLSLFIVFRLLFTAFAVALPIPSGVFFPVFIVGAALGRMFGEAMALGFPDGINGNPISPGGYAVVGAASLAGSVTHTISTSVIVFELTGQITHILPVMIAVLIANLVSGLLQPSVYDSIIVLKGLSYLPDLKPSRFYKLCAADIMMPDIRFLSYRSTFREVKFLLQTSHDASYPLVDAPDSRILIGSVSRHTLWQRLEEHMAGVKKHAQTIRDQAQLKSDTESEEQKPKRTLTPTKLGDSFSRRMSSVPHSLAKLFGSQDEVDTPEITVPQDGPSEEALDELREELLSKEIDVNTMMLDPAPFQLVERTSLYKVHSLFSILALTHAYVTSIGRLVGVVTITDLTNAIQGKKRKVRPPVLRLLPTAAEDQDTEVRYHVNDTQA